LVSFLQLVLSFPLDRRLSSIPHSFQTSISLVGLKPPEEKERDNPAASTPLQAVVLTTAPPTPAGSYNSGATQLKV
jgi:hypothetical protein